MESGIDSDQDDDRRSLSEAAAHVTRQTSSIDELIESLMLPPPPSSSVDADDLTPVVGQSDHIYAELVIPPPPPSHATDTADLDAFLAKIIACNGVINVPVTSKSFVDVPVTSKSFLGVPATNKCFGRQMSKHVSTVDSSSLRHHCRGASFTNNVQGVSMNQLGCCCTDVEVDTQQPSVSGGLEHVAARTPPRQDELVVGGTLTGRRPPPPPPRTSSVHSSPALSCRSEQLTRRSRDRGLAELPTSSSEGVRSALVRPAALRSSFSATTSTSPRDWNLGRSHSLTESMPPPGGRRSLLSRLKSYWSPSARRQRRPATATGHWWTQLDVATTRSELCSTPGLVEGVLNDVELTLQTSPTMSSFSSVACE